ncbi:MAG: hypothetical protein F6K14_12310 [Symploca sp. SIO2C1]|nr:hypothetical protein [Symploca sp. SIO2C1]
MLDYQTSNTVLLRKFIGKDELGELGERIRAYLSSIEIIDNYPYFSDRIPSSIEKRSLYLQEGSLFVGCVSVA